MRINMVGAFIRNAPFGTELAFAKGLELLGHEVTKIDTSFPNQVWNQNADATVVFKWMEGYWDELKACKGVKILYQPDDYRFSHIKKMVAEMRSFCDFALTFDSFGAIAAKQDYGYLLSEKMLVTANPDLYSYTPYDENKKDIDFCFVGSLTGGPGHVSRAKMIQVLSKAGLKVGYATDIYDARKIAELYARSKVVLNHATDIGQDFGTGWGYQCRHFEAGFVGSCILSNTIVDDAGEIINFTRFCDETSLVASAKMLLNNPSLRRALAESLCEELHEKHAPAIRAFEMTEYINKCQNYGT